MFTLIFSQSLTLEIHVAMPFSSRVKRDSERSDNQAFLGENVFFFFFFGGGGGGGIGTKRNSMGRAWIFSAKTQLRSRE